MDGRRANLNHGNAGHHIFLCVQRGASGVGGGGIPIIDVALFNPRKEGTVPRGYAIVSRTPNGRVANVNKGTDGEELFICYRPGIFERFVCVFYYTSICCVSNAVCLLSRCGCCYSTICVDI